MVKNIKKLLKWLKRKIKKNPNIFNIRIIKKIL